MKILLIQPPLSPRTYSLGQLEPLPLEILAATVPKHEVQILDLRFEKNLNDHLKTFRPDVVGTTAYTVEVSTAKKVLNKVKRADPKIATIIGGHHATMSPQDFMEEYVDIIVTGHAFVSFPRIISTLEEGKDLGNIRGIYLRREGEFFFTGLNKERLDIEKMPFPKRGLTRKYRSRYNLFFTRPCALLTTSLGCPFRCNFCACWKFTGGRYYPRSPEAVVEEIASIEEEHIFFGDDNTFHDVKRAERMYELIKEKGIRKRYGGYARSDTIARHPEIIEKWREIGMDALVVGLEAIDDMNLKSFQKRSSMGDNEKAIKVLRENRVTNLAHFLVKEDFERKDFHALLNYAVERDLWFPFFTILTPLPGTELYEKRGQELLINSYDLFDFAHPLLSTKLPIKEFIREYGKLYSGNYSLKRYLKSFRSAENSRPPLFALLMVKFHLFLTVRRLKRFYSSYY